MSQLTSEGQRVVNQLSQSSGFSPDAVTNMLVAVLNGNGSMAQFSHPEFGGSGQWMRGGMLMIGDMFNGYLKGRVDSLCNEISNILSREPGLFQTGSFQSQSQSGSGAQHQTAGGGQGQSSLFVPDPRANWWPAELGSPSATGSQNNLRYAYFAGSRRLAVDSGSEVWVYDTQDHQIGGFSQQQGSGSSIQFSSQYGTVSLASLPAISRNGQPVPSAPPLSPSAAPAPPADGNIFAAIERLGELKTKGLISDQEFATKKAELLARL
jgi:Short C-terminal domain